MSLTSCASCLEPRCFHADDHLIADVNESGWLLGLFYARLDRTL